MTAPLTSTKADRPECPGCVYSNYSHKHVGCDVWSTGLCEVFVRPQFVKTSVVTRQCKARAKTRRAD